MAKKKISQKGQEPEPHALSESETPLSSRAKALVFISHDSRDGDLAEAFGNLLSDVSAGTLKSFRSSDKKGTSGIEFGAEWYKSIMTQLGDATDVVALLTPRHMPNVLEHFLDSIPPRRPRKRGESGSPCEPGPKGGS